MVLQFVNEIRQEDIRILCQPTDRSKISKAYLNLSLKTGIALLWEVLISILYVSYRLNHPGYDLSFFIIIIIVIGQP